MSEKQYPTRNGIAIPPNEIWLPETELDLDFRPNHNNHHSHYTKRFFESAILLCTLRNIETHQTLLPLDVHQYIHSKYSPPKPPTKQQAMNELERAKDAGERLKYRQGGHYITVPFTDEIMKRCIDNYNNFRN